MAALTIKQFSAFVDVKAFCSGWRSLYHSAYPFPSLSSSPAFSRSCSHGKGGSWIGWIDAVRCLLVASRAVLVGVAVPTAVEGVPASRRVEMELTAKQGGSKCHSAVTLHFYLLVAPVRAPVRAEGLTVATTALWASARSKEETIDAGLGKFVVFGVANCREGRSR